MKKNKTRSVQAPKSANPELARAMQELRRSSAAEPHRNKARYDRKVKHKGRGWE
jgi:hypothetical protein